MKYFGITDKGKVRKDNQDCFIVKSGEGGALIAALCDGMGGARAGGLASDVAAKTFVAFVEERLSDTAVKKPLYKHVLSAACSEANGVVYHYSCFDANYSGMGTTIVGGIILPSGKAYVVNVGDSRAYHLSRRKVTQITRDHSLVEDMVERGEITREEARSHPRKNIITLALGLENDIHADVFETRLGKGEYLLFCSDGVSNLVTDEEFLDAARRYRTPESLCRSLLDKALSRNAPDNATAVAVQL